MLNGDFGECIESDEILISKQAEIQENKDQGGTPGIENDAIVRVESEFRRIMSFPTELHSEGNGHSKISHTLPKCIVTHSKHYSEYHDDALSEYCSGMTDGGSGDTLSMEDFECLKVHSRMKVLKVHSYTAARNLILTRSYHTPYTYQHLVENRMFIASY